eukprot:s1376_g21.t1
MYVERSRSRDDSPPSPPGRSHHRWPAHHQTQLPFPPSSSTSSEAPAWRDVVIVADFSEVSYLADENWNFSAMHPLNHVPLSMMEEKALWQYTRYVYSNQVDTYTFDHLLSGIAERIEEQWQIEISPDALELRYDENQGLEVFQVTSDQPYWNLRNLLDEYRPLWQTHHSASSHSEPALVLPASASSAPSAPDPTNPLLAAMDYSTTYGATPPLSSGTPLPPPFVPDTTDGALYPILNHYSHERRSPKHQLMFTVVEWNGGTETASRDLMVTETNLETGRPREHQIEFFFFKLVGDWPQAQRMGNYWRQHYGLDTYPIDTAPPSPLEAPTVSATTALDPAMVSAVRLITEIRNIPGAASLEDYQAKLIDMVRRSDVMTSFNSLQLTNLAIQLQQLSEVVASLETPPMETFSSMAANPTDDVHLTDIDHIDL